MHLTSSYSVGDSHRIGIHIILICHYSVILSLFAGQHGNIRWTAFPSFALGAILGLVTTVQGLALCDDLLPYRKRLSCYRTSRSARAWTLPLRTPTLLCEYNFPISVTGR